MLQFLTDGGGMVVRDDNEEDVYYSSEEFTEIYGEEALPDKPEPIEPEPEETPTDTDRYYEVMVEFLNDVGSYLHLKKLGVNADAGIFPAQKIAYDYKHTGANFEIELNDRKNRYLKALTRLSETGRKVGLPPINEEGRRSILRFVKDRCRRQYIRSSAKRAQKRQVVYSIAEIMQKRIDLEKKRNS